MNFSNFNVPLHDCHSTHDMYKIQLPLVGWCRHEGIKNGKL